VGALTGSSAIVRKAWQAQSTITVQNQVGALVPKVVVKGVYSSAPRSTLSCTTATNGSCVIRSGTIPMTVASTQFTVTSLTPPRGGSPYDPTRNVKTTVTINRP
jgi:hypothetical protein